MSAFLVSNLIRSVQSEIPCAKHAKPAEDKTDVMNVELKINSGAFNVYGEISICDYIVQQKNLTLPKN